MQLADTQQPLIVMVTSAEQGQDVQVEQSTDHQNQADINQAEDVSVVFFHVMVQKPLFLF